MQKNKGRPKGGFNMKYEPEFKIKIASELANHKIGFREAERIYGINTPVLFNWHRIYLEEGENALYKERRGRPRLGYAKPKISSKVEEDLLKENQRLRMENEYLKKLEDLVQKRIQSELKKQK